MKSSGLSVGSTTISCSASCRPITDQYYIIVHLLTNQSSVLCCSHLGLVLAGHVCPADPRAAPGDDLVKDGLHQLGVAALDQLTQQTIISISTREHCSTITWHDRRRLSFSAAPLLAAPPLLPVAGAMELMDPDRDLPPPGVVLLRRSSAARLFLCEGI